MANICSNQYKFIFSDETKAKKFFVFVEGETTDTSSSVYELGIKAGIKNAKNRDIREWVDNAFINFKKQNVVQITTESKWTPCPNAWVDIATTFDENVGVTYEAEEPGCGIWASNDPELIGQYVLDPIFDSGFLEIDELDYGIVNPEWVVSLLKKLLGEKTYDINLLLEKLKKSKYKDVLFIHEIEDTPISDWGE